MNKRKSIPEKLKRELMREVGWRCAIPTCRANSPLEHAHINPVKNNGKNDFFNLIILCKNCHGRFHDKKEKYMTLEEMINIKKNLMVLNHRYNSYEKRILEYFLDNPEADKTLPLLDRDIDIMYLIKDGLLVHDGKTGANIIGLAPKTYIITEKGKNFLHEWKSAIFLDKNDD
ncbi:MAG TPA: HNH endonuclease signature motif containing protein [Gammaproteobacteria bacterium]|nr:HNH endonuclease signature motif containing protein [Gammaproteobacteria bacterium]